MGSSQSSSNFFGELYDSFSSSIRSGSSDMMMMSYILGCGYYHNGGSSSSSGSSGDDERMRRHVSSFFRFTYRMNFESFTMPMTTTMAISDSIVNADMKDVHDSVSDPDFNSPVVVSSSAERSDSSSPTTASSAGGVAMGGGGGGASSFNRLTSQFGSDAGWGCMLRAAQMVMGHVLIRHCLGKEWRFDGKTDLSPQYVEILRLFMDYSHESNKFSIHRMIASGSNPGEWCGPVKASHILKEICANNRRAESSPLTLAGGNGGNSVDNIEVFVCSGGAIYYDEVTCHMIAANRGGASSSAARAATSVGSSSTGNSNSSSSSNDGRSDNKHSTTDPLDPFFDPLLNTPPPAAPKEWENALLLFVPLRLGINSVDKPFHKQIKKALRHPNSVGMLGGKVNHAMYFIGSNTSGQYLGLDPHVVFSTAKLDEKFPSPDLLAQVHVNECEFLEEGLLDPSVSLAYYFANRREFEEFYVSQISSSSSSSSSSSKNALAAKSDFDHYDSSSSKSSKKKEEDQEASAHKLFTMDRFAPNFAYGEDAIDDEVDLNVDSDDEYIFV